MTDHYGVDSVISHISLPGVSFGELSLMYGKPRTATVTCVQDGWLWCLERRAFRGVLVDRMTHDNTVKILRKVCVKVVDVGIIRPREGVQSVGGCPVKQELLKVSVSIDLVDNRAMRRRNLRDFPEGCERNGILSILHRSYR